MLRQPIEDDPGEDREGDPVAFLAVHLGHEVGRGDVERHATGDRQRRSDEGGDAEDRQPADEARRP